MAPDSSAHRDEELPGAGAPPAEPAAAETAVGKARVFAHAKRTIIAIAIAAFATVKVGKWAVLGLWNVRNVDEVQQAPDWALHHWAIVLVAAAVIFAAVFALTRFVLGKL